MENIVKTCTNILRAIIDVTKCTGKEGKLRRRCSYVKEKEEILRNAKIFSSLINDFEVAENLVELANQLRGEVGVQAFHIILESGIMKIKEQEFRNIELLGNVEFLEKLDGLSSQVAKYKQILMLNEEENDQLSREEKMSLENTGKGLSRAHVDNVFKEKTEFSGEVSFFFII